MLNATLGALLLRALVPFPVITNSPQRGDSKMQRAIVILLLLITATPFAPMQARQRGNASGGAGTSSRFVTTQSYEYQLGARRVVIPPPAGFVDAFTRAEDLAKILTATESPSNEVLAAHVSLEDLNRMNRGEQAGVTFYTKVSVLRSAKTQDISEAQYAALVAKLESTVSQVLDINGPTMKSAVRNMRGGLSEVTGQDVQLDLEQPQNLGSFEKTKDVYSTMLLMVLKGPRGKLPLVGAASFVRVNNRLLFIYTYRKFNSEKDVEVLRDFTREWLRQIMAANR
jgi:hypothetical protein